MRKTNVMRILESESIPYDTAFYEYEEGAGGAEIAAQKLVVEPERVFKTLVASDEEEALFVFCIPGNASLDLKKAARVAGSRRIRLVEINSLKPLTGYVRGGCSPIGMKKPYPVYVEELASVFDWIFINAGKRGIQIKLDPEVLKRLVDAEFVNITSG